MMNKLTITTRAVLIYTAGFSQSFDRPQESAEDPSAALNQIADRYVEKIIKARPFLVYSSLSEFFEPDHSALPDRSPAALKTFEKIEDETLSFSTSLAQGAATNQELTTVGNLDFRSVIIENEEFLHHGDTVVLIGNNEMKGSIMGYTIDATIRYMTEFVHDEGRWKMLSGSFSPVVHPGVLYGEPEEV
jgi:hypothetical protein